MRPARSEARVGLAVARVVGVIEGVLPMAVNAARVACSADSVSNACVKMAGASWVGTG